jgi:hypothetical protein
MNTITTDLTKSSYFLIKTELNQVVGVIYLAKGNNLDKTKKLCDILTKRFKVDDVSLCDNLNLNNLTSNLKFDAMLERKPCLYITETFILEKSR